MKERTVWLIFVSIPAFLLIFGVVVGLIVCLRYRPIKPQPLPLKTVEWKFPSKVNWIALVDLDADGRSELLVQDENRRLWWAEWNGKKPFFEPVPIQTPSIVLRHPFWAWEKRTFIATELDPIFVDVKTDFVRIITRSENKWQTVRITAKPLVRKAINGVVGILDLDGDGSANDVLILSDFQTLEWWQRQRSGKLVRRDRLKLPKPYELYRLRTTLGWKSCALWLPGSIAFASMEKGRLLWKGESAQKFFWTDADIDGDGAKDRVEWVEWRNNKEELLVRFADGKVQALKLPEECSVTVRDLDGDGQAEILILGFTKATRHELLQKLILWRFDRKTRRWLRWRKEIAWGCSMSSPQGLFGMAVEKPQSDGWGLLTITKRGNRLQVERLRLKETGWQSEFVAVLPKVKGEAHRSTGVWTGSDLIFVEDQNPKWLLLLRDAAGEFRQAIFHLIGLKSLAKAPTTFAPHRIWGWHPEKRRWILLGHALSTPSNYEGHWTVTRIGSGNEVAIVWWSAP
ncbi:FG-GAP repeat domain-containing protein, partial [Fervidibacter sp.]